MTKCHVTNLWQHLALDLTDNGVTSFYFHSP
jgi:hypothetical protein